MKKNIVTYLLMSGVFGLMFPIVGYADVMRTYNPDADNATLLNAVSAETNNKMIMNDAVILSTPTADDIRTAFSNYSLNGGSIDPATADLNNVFLKALGASEKANYELDNSLTTFKGALDASLANVKAAGDHLDAVKAEAANDPTNKAKAAAVAKATQEYSDAYKAVSVFGDSTEAERLAKFDGLDNQLTSSLKAADELAANKAAARAAAEVKAKAIIDAIAKSKPTAAEAQAAADAYIAATADVTAARKVYGQALDDSKAANNAARSALVNFENAKAAIDADPNNPAKIAAVAKAASDLEKARVVAKNMEKAVATASENIDAAEDAAKFALDKANAINVARYGPSTPKPDDKALVQCGRSGTAKDQTEDCDFVDLIGMINTLIDYLIMIAMPLAAIAFAYAGWLRISAGDNSGQVTKSNHVFTMVGIGLIVILSGWLVFTLIADTFLKTTTDATGEPYETYLN